MTEGSYEKELVSIVIPCYNAEPYLRACLDSIIAQTYANWECLIINDGSTDKSADIVTKYTQSDKRFRLVNKDNDGASNARRDGVEFVKRENRSRLISFVDADDTIDPQYLDVMCKPLIKENADISFCMHNEIRDGEIKSNSKEYEYSVADITDDHQRISFMSKTLDIVSSVTVPPHLSVWGGGIHYGFI